MLHEAIYPTSNYYKNAWCYFFSLILFSCGVGFPPNLVSLFLSHCRPCLPRVSRALYSLLKGVVWLMLLTLLITTLFLILIEFNGVLKQCGGRVCHHPLLHMILGQNLQYTRNGTVAM